MENKKMLGWHFSPTDKKLRYGDGRVIRSGVRHKVDGKPKLCVHGLHASPFKVDSFKVQEGTWHFKLRWTGYTLDLSCQPVLSGVQVPDHNPIAILSPYTGTSLETACWAAWMEVMEIDGNSTDPKDGILLSVGLLHAALTQLGGPQLSNDGAEAVVHFLHAFLKKRFNTLSVFRPSDLADGVRFLLSQLPDPEEEEEDLREVLTGKFSLSCRLSLRDTYDRYVTNHQKNNGDEALGYDELKKQCLDSISHMAIYPDGRVIFLKGINYLIEASEDR